MAVEGPQYPQAGLKFPQGGPLQELLQGPGDLSKADLIFLVSIRLILDTR